MSLDNFQLLLGRAARHLGSQVALARALGVDPTRISRLLKSRGDYPHLNFENCLRLAAILDLSPNEVLTAAGHTEQAALLERWCGPQRPDMSIKSSEWQLLQMWRDLPVERQTALLTLLKTEGGPVAAITDRREFPRSARRGGT